MPTCGIFTTGVGECKELVKRGAWHPCMQCQLEYFSKNMRAFESILRVYFLSGSGAFSAREEDFSGIMFVSGGEDFVTSLDAVSRQKYLLHYLACMF